MCWNKEVSLGSFIIISLVCIMLFNRNLPNDRVMAIFIMTYGSMQLAETIIWVGLEYNKPIINKIGTVLATLLLYLFPLGLLLGIKYDNFYNNIKKNIVYKVFCGIGILLFVIGIINTLYRGLNKHKYLSYVTQQSPHLVWDIPKYLEHQYIIGFILIIIVLFYIVFPKNKIFALLIMAFLSITCIYSIIMSPEGIKRVIFRSYWCWIVAILSFLIYFTNPILQKYNIVN